MNKNFIFLVMMVMALVFGLTVVGCDNDTTIKDTWSELKDFNKLNGTWKANYSQNNRPIKDVAEEMGMPLDSSTQAMLGDMKVAINADITLTINTSARTQAMSIKATATFSDGNINSVWPMLSMYLSMYLDQLEAEGVKVTPNDKKHSVTVDYTMPPEEFTDEDIGEMLNSGLLINQNGTKIKVPAESLQSGMPGMPEMPEMPELIFYKQ